MKVYEAWDFFKTIRKGKRERNKKRKKAGHELVIIEMGDEYMEFIMLFSLLLYVFEIFFDKRIKKMKSFSPKMQLALMVVLKSNQKELDYRT